MERTAVAGAVAEEHHGHLIGLQDILEGQSSAGGQIVAAAHDAVGAQHADGEIGDVHGAAAALAQARLLAEDLRHHAVDIGALGHAVTMAAVGGFNHIVITQSGAHAGGDGFLTDVGVGEAGDLAGEEVVLDALLKLADRAHRLIELDGKFFRVNCIVRHNDHAPFSTFRTFAARSTTVQGGIRERKGRTPLSASCAPGETPFRTHRVSAPSGAEPTVTPIFSS